MSDDIEDEKHFLLDCQGYVREREMMFETIRVRTIAKYDFTRMRDNSDWLMKALLGKSVGVEKDRKTIRLAVGRYLSEAYNLRKARLGSETEEVPVASQSALSCSVLEAWGLPV